MWELCSGVRAYRGLSSGEVVQGVLLRGLRPHTAAAAATAAALASSGTAGAAAKTLCRLSASRTTAATAAPVPVSVPEPLMELMELCWAAEPEERPTFEDVLYHIDCLGESARVSRAVRRFRLYVVPGEGVKGSANCNAQAQ